MVLVLINNCPELSVCLILNFKYKIFICAHLISPGLNFTPSCNNLDTFKYHSIPRDFLKEDDLMELRAIN